MQNLYNNRLSMRFLFYSFISSSLYVPSKFNMSSGSFLDHEKLPPQIFVHLLYYSFKEVFKCAISLIAYNISYLSFFFLVHILCQLLSCNLCELYIKIRTSPVGRSLSPKDDGLSSRPTSSNILFQASISLFKSTTSSIQCYILIK